MRHRLVGIIFRFGLVALLVGALSAFSALAAAGTAGLHVVPSPLINDSSLSAAAAIAPNDIWAVGDVAPVSGGTQTLAEHFNGTSWSVVSTPTLNAVFNGVAGAATNDVWAVGNPAVGSSFFDINTLIEHWDGTTWSVVSSPKLPKGSALTGVSAPSSTDVWAVGFENSSPGELVEHWDGTRWNVVSSSAFAGVSDVYAISADSSRDVWAVGALAAGGTTSLHWNGHTWTQVPTAHLRFGGVVALTALSPINVWAAGTGPGVPTGGFSAHPTAVIEHWDGTSWSVVPSPNPNPQGNNSASAIVAVGASDIWAFGLQLQGPFTEHWNGAGWSIVSTPSGVASINGATALSGGSLVAVGHGTNNSGTILSN
jgi:hypothetical protein